MCNTHTVAMTNTLVGTTEAARLLGIDRSTLGRWVRSGRLVPAVRLPGATGAYLFDQSEVDRVVTERTAA